MVPGHGAQPGPNALGDFSELLAVRCRVASDCWAVGDYSKGGATLDQAVHWNGTKWSVVSTPTPGGTLNGDDNELFDVVCPAASTCWASGEYGTNAGAGVILNQLLRWNGTTWSTLTVPSPGGTAAGDFNELTALACTSASNCWAAGTDGAVTPR